MNWSPPLRPAAYAEQALVTAILDGTYTPGSLLPAERELAARLGITRPTLREALRRLECDGWVAVQQGKPTLVKDFWRDGGLNVLGALVRYNRQLPAGFVQNLLEVRLALAPAYTRAAVVQAPHTVAAQLSSHDQLADTPAAYAAFDWALHHALTIASGNPVFSLILNGFAGFYEDVARSYFQTDRARTTSRAFYADLLRFTVANDADGAENLTRQVMQESIRIWQAIAGEVEAPAIQAATTATND